MRHNRMRGMYRVLPWMDRLLGGFSIGAMLAAFWAMYISRNTVI